MYLVSGATTIDTPDKEQYEMTMFTLAMVLVATTASTLTIVLIQSMTKQIVKSETKALRKKLHKTQLQLQYTTEYYDEKVESAVRIARDAVRARDFYKSFTPRQHHLDNIRKLRGR